MTWKARSGPGSFRGVPFNVEAREIKGGRKLVKHEYPLKDSRYAEDLGLKDRIVPVECYLIGSDYIQQRDALLAVLEMKGPGKLVLPYDNFENSLFSVDEFTESENREEGGYASFVITFVRSDGKALLPVKIIDRKAGLQIKITSAMDAVKKSTESKFVTQIRQFRNSGTALLNSASNALKGSLNKISSVFDPVKEVAEELTQFSSDINRTIDGLITDADEMIREPFSAAQRFKEAFESIFQSPSLPERNIEALLEAYDFAPTVGTPSLTTANRIQEAANYDLLTFMVKSYALCAAASFATSVEFESYEQAKDIRNSIADRLDEQIKIADDNAYSALVDLRAALANAVPGEESDLPRILNFTPIVTLPSLVVAHMVYGNVDNELDLVSRNSIQNPAFVIGGRSLEYLSDA